MDPIDKPKIDNIVVNVKKALRENKITLYDLQTLIVNVVNEATGWVNENGAKLADNWEEIEKRFQQYSSGSVPDGSVSLAKLESTLRSGIESLLDNSFLLNTDYYQLKLTINESAGVIKAKIGDKTYAINGASEVVPVSTPSMTKDGSDTSASRKITLSCSTSGATIYYTTNGSTPTSSSTKYTKEFYVSASETASSTSTTIKAIAIKNGESSSVFTEVVKTARHLAAPTISPSGDKYALSRIVTISGATGATFKDESGNSVASTKNVTSTTTIKVKQVLSEWQDSEFAELEVAIGKPMTYIGCLSSTTITEQQIASLTASPLHRDGLATGTAYSVTASATSYIWICQPNTLTPDNVFNDAQYSSKTGVEEAVTIGSWKCYRTSNRVVAGTYSLYLKP